MRQSNRSQLRSRPSASRRVTPKAGPRMALLAAIGSCATLALASGPARGADGKSEPASDPYAAYERGQYGAALERFLDWQVDHPRDPRLALNIGNALYKMGRYEEAARAYAAAEALLGANNSALSDEQRPRLQAEAAYNAGNAQFRRGNFKSALERYRQALERAPDDSDARYNLRATRRALKAKQQQKTSDNERAQSRQSDSNGAQKQTRAQGQAAQDNAKPAQSGKQQNKESITSEQAASDSGYTAGQGRQDDADSSKGPAKTREAPATRGQQGDQTRQHQAQRETPSPTQPQPAKQADAGANATASGQTDREPEDEPDTDAAAQGGAKGAQTPKKPSQHGLSAAQARRLLEALQADRIGPANRESKARTPPGQKPW